MRLVLTMAKRLPEQAVATLVDEVKRGFDGHDEDYYKASNWPSTTTVPGSRRRRGRCGIPIWSECSGCARTAVPRRRRTARRV